MPRASVLAGHEALRVYANGIEGSVHTDSDGEENYFTTIDYAHEYIVQRLSRTKLWWRFVRLRSLSLANSPNRIEDTAAYREVVQIDCVDEVPEKRETPAMNTSGQELAMSTTGLF